MEPTHQKIQEQVTAFQMTKERCMNNEEWPEWLHDAFKKERDSVGSFQEETVGEFNGNWTLVIPELKVTMNINVLTDSWLFINSKGVLTCYYNESFIERFEEIPPSTPEMETGVMFYGTTPEEWENFCVNVGVFCNQIKEQFEKINRNLGVYLVKFNAEEGVVDETR